MTIRQKILLLLAVTVPGIFIAGSLGLGASIYTSHKLKHIVEDRAEPLRSLQILQYQYASEIPSIANQLNGGEITAGEGLAMLQHTQETIASQWRIYQSSQISASEKALISRSKNAVQACDQEVMALVMLIESLHQQHQELLSHRLDMIQGAMYPRVHPVTLALDSLALINLQGAHQDYEDSRYWLILSQILTWILIFAGSAIAAGLGHAIYRRIHTQLEESLQAFTRIGQGDLTAHAAVKTKDELGQIAQGTNLLIFSLRRMVGHIIYSSAKIGTAARQTATETSDAAAAIIQSEVEASLGLVKVRNYLNSLPQGAESSSPTVAKIMLATRQLIADLNTLENSSQNAISQLAKIQRSTTELTALSKELDTFVGQFRMGGASRPSK